MTGNAGLLIAVIPAALLAFLYDPSRAAAGMVKKVRLGTMNIQSVGLDLNGDDFNDAVLVNIVSGEQSLMLGREKGGFTKTSLQSLSPEEKDYLPDMFTEVDLDGDHVNDLVVVNRGRLPGPPTIGLFSGFSSGASSLERMVPISGAYV